MGSCPGCGEDLSNKKKRGGKECFALFNALAALGGEGRILLVKTPEMRHDGRRIKKVQLSGKRTAPSSPENSGQGKVDEPAEENRSSPTQKKNAQRQQIGEITRAHGF